MARGGTQTERLTADELVRRSWPARLEGWRPSCHTDLLTDLAATLLHRPHEIGAAMARVGRDLGREGWLLREVAAAVDHLGGLAWPRAHALSGFAASMALGQGWADGFLDGLDRVPYVDALTGLGTMAVLTMRLEQLYDAAERSGHRPVDTHRLLVIETDPVARLPLELEAELIRLAETVRSVFTSAQTAVRAGHRIVVLVGRDSTIERAWTSDVLTWVEELPDARAALAQMVRELSGPADVD